MSTRTFNLLMTAALIAGTLLMAASVLVTHDDRAINAARREQATQAAIDLLMHTAIRHAAAGQMGLH
jgi:hypothetical protein